MQELPTPIKSPVKPPKDPTAASRTWAIALVTSAGLLLAAIGVVVWLVYVRGAGGVAVAPAAPVDPSINVKNVTFVLPADMPATYIKNDQSKVGESVVFYDDEATMCSIMLAILPADATKKPQDVALERIAASYTLGMSVNGITGADQVSIRDADATHEYTFDAVTTEVGVNVTGVGYTGRQQTVLFRKLGNQVTAISYSCKTETWAAKQAEFATIVAGITVKTER